MGNLLIEPARAGAVSSPPAARPNRERFLVEEAPSLRELRKVWSFGHAVIVATRSPRVTIVPANTRLAIQENEIGRVMAVSLEPGFVVSTAAGLGAACAELQPVRDVHDSLIAELVRALKAASTSLFAETLATALAMRLVSKYGRTGMRLTSTEPRLGKAQLAAVMDYINEDPGRDLGVKDLADVAGLSLSHFIRTFHQSTGVSPHQYLLRTRLTRAKELLSQTRYSIADIARMTGFAGQSHFTKHFGRFAGMTPRRYRLRAG